MGYDTFVVVWCGSHGDLNISQIFDDKAESTSFFESCKSNDVGYILHYRQGYDHGWNLLRNNETYTIVGEFGNTLYRNKAEEKARKKFCKR